MKNHTKENGRSHGAITKFLSSTFCALLKTVLIFFSPLNRRQNTITMKPAIHVEINKNNKIVTRKLADTTQLHLARKLILKCLRLDNLSFVISINGRFLHSPQPYCTNYYNLLTCFIVESSEKCRLYISFLKNAFDVSRNSDTKCRLALAAKNLIL